MSAINISDLMVTQINLKFVANTQLSIGHFEIKVIETQTVI